MVKSAVASNLEAAKKEIYFLSNRLATSEGNTETLEEEVR